ncbi:uncharacterized protein LOC143195261 [Rhynchophorus ferrugineus]|uniref:uncharacterized protein LOC143195261 n=1 Tax=Rhynchophorus ferrugineus TaxID=354439 RepID=UPI003FCC5DD8
MAEQPAWIVHLEYMLSQYYKADIKIMEEFIEILSKPTHLKVTVVVKKGSLSEPEQFVYFVKLYENIVPYHIRMDLLAKFVKEVDLYTVALPAIKEFQKAGNTYALPYDQIFPSCIGARLSTKSNMPDETGVLILENLNEMGYTRPDVRAGLDLETSKLVLHKMAHLHATPLAMKFLDSDLDLFKQKIVPCLVEVKYAKEPFCYQDVDRLVTVMNKMEIQYWESRLRKS